MSFGLGQQQRQQATLFAPVDSSTPWVAAADGNLPLLQHALQQLNLPITATDSNGYTLLQAAASYSQMAVLTWVLEQEAAPSFVNAVDQDGDSALHYASTATAAQFLVERAHTSTAIQNAAGLTALQAKKQELQELLEDEDTEDDDVDVLHLKGIIEYLESLEARHQ